MNAQTIYLLLKPHLQNLDPQEKKKLSDLICREKPLKVTRHHKKVLPFSKAKETLESGRKQFILRERQEKRM